MARRFIIKLIRKLNQTIAIVKSLLSQRLTLKEILDIYHNIYHNFKLKIIVIDLLPIKRIVFCHAVTRRTASLNSLELK